ncbi:MAG: sugar ABC transporter permease [Hyphomicrobiales bacterium]|nr:MAG: sugar ABC transporter permease [Hyphomicrobiales bacterium]
MIMLERRRETSRVMKFASPLLALVLTVISGAALFGLLGFDPLEALYQFFIAPVMTSYGIAELLLKATPLILIGVGLAIGYRANVWNIGAEGQLIIGAIAGGAIGLALHGVDSVLVLPLMIAGGILGGMAWAAIPALLRTHFNASELLTSLMLTYVAELLLTWAVNGPLKDPDGFSFPESKMFHDSASMPLLLEGTRLHGGFLAALIVVLLGWFFISRSLPGYEVRVTGSAPHAARFAGFSQTVTIWMTLLAGGALAGLAGLFEVAGPVGQLVPKISPGYGFTAIIVAFLGRLHPVGILFAGLLVALSYLGGEMAQITLNMPLAVTGVFQGLLLFFLLGVDILLTHRIRIGHIKPRSAS